MNFIWNSINEEGKEISCCERIKYEINSCRLLKDTVNQCLRAIFQKRLSSVRVLREQIMRSQAGDEISGERC